MPLDTSSYEITLNNQVNTLNDIRLMQRTLDKLVALGNSWDMEFNVNKCGAMHIGKRNLEFQNQINEGSVKSVDERKNLGVLISKDFKFLKHLLVKSKGNLMLGIINKGVSYKYAELISKLRYVRPQLDFVSSFGHQ